MQSSPRIVNGSFVNEQVKKLVFRRIPTDCREQAGINSNALTGGSVMNSPLVMEMLNNDRTVAENSMVVFINPYASNSTE